MASVPILSTTGLYSYETIAHLVDDLLDRSDQNRSHALFLVDHGTLDNINNMFGREAGDAVIAHTTQVLPAVFRATDLVARTHDDEFIVFMKDVSSLDAIECIAGLVLQLLRCPCGTQEHAVEATVSVGIAMSDGQAPRTFNELYDNACTALFDAKRAKDHRFVIYDCNGKPAHGQYGFDRLVNASTSNYQPFLDTLANGGVLLRAEPKGAFVPQYFSDSFLALLGGMAREEALSVYGDDMVAGMHPDDRQRMRDEIKESLATETPLRTIARMRKAGGGYVWVSITAMWARENDGRINAYAIHSSVESIIENYDYAYSGMQKPSTAGMPLYMFAVTFEGGNPSGYSIFDENGVRLSGLEDESLPDALLQHGIINADSEDGLRDLYDSIVQGEKYGGMLVLCSGMHDGVLHWARISYVMTYDEGGLPLRASGNIRELPHIATAQGRFFREEKLFEAIGSQMLRSARIDLTAGLAEKVTPESLGLDGVTYGSLVANATAKYCYADDAVDIMRLVSRGNVLRMISEGTFQLTKEFRREDAGRIRWTSLVAHIVENPLNHHMIAFVYIADIERRHVEVAFASVFAKPNATTGLYSKESLERIAAAIQQADTPEEPLAAVAVIRVAMPADLRAMLSVENSSSGQVFLGQQLSVCLAQEGLVARYGADGFLVLFPRVDSETWLRQRIEASIADLRKAYVDKDGNAHPIVLACGYAIEEVSEMRFNDAVARAKSACRVNEAEPTGSLWSFDERVGQMRRAMKPGSGRSMRTVSAEEMNRPLTGAEREALDAAMHAMIMANNYDEAITNVLGVLGQACHAHRVFTVALLENGMVAGLHEWYEPGAPPIIGQLMGRPLKEYGTLQNSASAGMPVLVERVHAKRRNTSDEGARLWRFIAFPVMKYGMCAGFLCVEDPYINSTDVALINSLMPMITCLRDREGGISTTSISRLRDKLTGLPGRTMFERNAITFDSSLFHSVAVLRVGLERIYTLEGDRDTENENKLLLYAARNLTGLFPLDSTYRTDELQLTCVVTNMSYDAFNARTTRMAAIMRQRMRNGFALCDAWSDAMPSLSKLLEEAGTSVYGDRSIFFPDERSHAISTMPSFQRAFDGDAFSVRLQPQVDLKTGEVVGSEALARCLTPSGETIPPSEFIPRMEAEGNVSGLDYFVFEKVLATLNDWADRGLKPLPVAVNFSRQTVLDPSFVASILALTSRYDVPEDLLEIEITESMGAFKNMELRGAMETLRGQSFRFALDDLGSECSTLSAMSDLPFDTVKLDRLLVKRFTDDSMSRSIVEGIARACEKNGIRCVAEGVEFASYIEPLVSMGCHYGQGYCFARPMTIDQFTNEFLVDANEDAERTIPIPKGDGEE